MSIENILSVSAAKSYKTDPAGVVSGVVEGIAFRARISEGQLEMSVNLPEANLAKLQNKLGGRYPGNTVAYQNFGIVVTLPDMAGMSGEDFTTFLEIAAKDAGKLIGVSYDDKFEKDREPFLSYLRGIAGALLGAVIGVLPWFLCSYFLNWGLWFLGFLVSTVSFYGYRQFYGTHNTTFATICIVCSTILAVMLSQTVELTLSLASYMPNFAFPESLIAYLQQGGWKDLIGGSLWGLLAAGAGLAVIVKQITIYTHEPWFLRRNKGRRNKK